MLRTHSPYAAWVRRVDEQFYGEKVPRDKKVLKFSHASTDIDDRRDNEFIV